MTDAGGATDPLTPSKFWETSGEPHTIRQVLPKSCEWDALEHYFLRAMPNDTSLQCIRRVENQPVWQRYKSYRNQISQQVEAEGSKLDGIEMYLWHGSDAVDEEVEKGFDHAHTNMEFNVYGAGIYFAVDPRHSHHFIRDVRGQPDACFRLILAQVAVGLCAEKEPIVSHAPGCQKKGPKCQLKKCRDLRRAELVKLEHRQAPKGHHSCTSKHHTEVVVYKDFHAYPAYIFEYRCPSLASFDPYKNQAHLKFIRWAYRFEHVVHWDMFRHRGEQEGPSQGYVGLFKGPYRRRTKNSPQGFWP